MAINRLAASVLALSLSVTQPSCVTWVARTLYGGDCDAQTSSYIDGIREWVIRNLHFTREIYGQACFRPDMRHIPACNAPLPSRFWDDLAATIYRTRVYCGNNFRGGQRYGGVVTGFPDADNFGSFSLIDVHSRDICEVAGTIAHESAHLVEGHGHRREVRSESDVDVSTLVGTIVKEQCRTVRSQ